MGRFEAAVVVLGALACGCGDSDVVEPAQLPPPVVLASGQKSPRALAVDDDGVYWTNEGDGTIVMLARGETQPRVLAKGQGRALGIAVDKDAVYWTSYGTEGKTDGAVRKTSKLKKGDVLDLMIAQEGPIGIALDDNCVFWTTGGSKKANGVVMSLWKEGVVPVPVASGESGPVDVARDLSGVYWLDRGIGPDGEGAAVKRVKQIGDPAMVLAPDGSVPSRLALDPDRVIWEDSGELQQVPKDGGAARAIATGQPGVSGLAVDASGIYWTSGDGEVKRVPAEGGAAETLAIAQQGAGDVAVDARGVYWVNAELGAVLMLPK